MHKLCVYLITAPRDLLCLATSCVATIMLLYCTIQASGVRKDGVTVVYF